MKNLLTKLKSKTTGFFSVIKLQLFFAIFTLSILTNNMSTASHISGGDISFQCVGPNTYNVTLNLFRDCDGITMSNTEFMNATSTCGGNIQITLNLANVGGTNISQLCPSDSLNSTCFGGNLPGMQLYTYTGTVVLAPPCNTWTLSWSTCCRNNTVNVPSSSSDDIYIEATLNTVTSPCNNSPTFTSQPIPYVCANQIVNYNFGVTEPDGDSLSFQFVSAMQMGGTPLNYAGGYSGSVPIPGISIDPLTGQISFTPTTQGNFIVVVQCNEYDNSGNLISTTMRDIQFVVLPCSNNLPDINAGQITNLIGNAVITSTNSIDICEGNTFSFTAVYTDPDINDSLFVNTNIGIVLPNSSYSISGFNPLTVVYTWTVPAGASGTNTTFVVQIEDNACPITGMQTFVYDINVLDRTIAFVDQTICGNQSAQLFATGGSLFTWKDLSGNLIPISPQFSCNPCSSPVATPPSTTTYVVESNLVGSCINMDTVTVTVVPDFTFNITQSQSSACLLQPIQLSTNVNPPGLGYNYFWFPSSSMNNPNIPNPLANFNQSGPYTVYLNIENQFGCTKIDSLQINISNNIAPVISIVSDTVCTGQSNQLQIEFGSTVPVNCGTSATPCSSPVQTGNIGNGILSNGNTTYPNVFGNWYWGSKHQILYTASELNSMGFSGGKISSIGFNLNNLNGSTSVYQNFEIKMMCTTLSSLNSFQTGLQTVFPAQNVTPVIGWNNFNLSPLYEWDGQSNIIVEICFNNTSYTNNCSNTYTLTPFTSVVYFYQDASGVCNNPTFSNTSNQRPNTRFNFCVSVANPNQFTYQWSNPNYVSDPTIPNPVTTINYDTTYQVVVTAIQGGCSDTASITINNTPLPGSAEINLPSIFTYCLNDPSIQLTTASPGGIWSGPGVDPMTGIFSPQNAGIGTHQIVYAITGSTQCVNRDTIYLGVIGSPNAMINYTGNDTICITTSPFPIMPFVPGGNWSGNGIDYNTGVFSPQVAGPGNHIIIYSMGSGNCIDMDQITLTVISEPSDSITIPQEMCETDTPVNLSSITSGGTWSGSGVSNLPNPTFNPQISGTGLIILTYTYSSICSFTSTGSITVLPPPPTPIISNNSPLCEGEDLQFITTTIQNVQYFWSGPNSFSSNLQNPSIVNVDVNDSGKYSCVINLNGCFSQIGYSNVVIYDTPPQPNIYSNDPICEGEDLVIFTDPLPNTSFLWSGPNGFSTNDREFTIPYVDNSASGQYQLIAISNNCISPQSGIFVTINPNPISDFQPDPSITDITAPQVLFVNNSSSGQYLWDFGDGNTSTVNQPFYIYSDTGNYSVTLTVTNSQTGCSSQTIQSVLINPYFRMFIPNTFTPNQDGLNENFIVHTDSYKYFRLTIYDRWGQILFDTTKPEQGWNGKFNENDVPQGVYTYQVSVTTLKDEKKRFVGTVTILR